jgi:hypothetical protein
MPLYNTDKVKLVKPKDFGLFSNTYKINEYEYDKT